VIGGGHIINAHPDHHYLKNTIVVVNDHRLKAGGFRLRLKAGSVRRSADYVT